MNWFFDKMKGWRGFAITWAGFATFYVDWARETLSAVTSVLGMPLDDVGSGSAFAIALFMSLKVAWGKLRGSD